MAKIKVVWREWFNEPTIAKLEAMGTLPRNEIEIDGPFIDGEDVAETVAKAVNDCDPECFREGGTITITEPKEYAGDYEISVDYDPVFRASEMM